MPEQDGVIDYLEKVLKGLVTKPDGVSVEKKEDNINKTVSYRFHVADEDKPFFDPQVRDSLDTITGRADFIIKGRVWKVSLKKWDEPI